MGTFQASISVRPDTLGPAGSRYGAGHAAPRNGHNNSLNVAKIMSGTVVYDAAQTVTATINGVPITVSTDTDAATTRGLLVVAINASAFLNTKVQAADGAGGVFTLTSLIAGLDFTLTGAGTGSADITPISTTTANSAEQPMDAGIFVKRGSNAGEVRLLESGDVLADIVGMLEHRHQGAELETLSSEKQYSAHSQVPVAYRGEYVVDVEDAVAEGATPFVRIIASGVNSQTGKLRSDADGSNAIALTGAKFMSSTSGAGKARVAINMA